MKTTSTKTLTEAAYRAGYNNALTATAERMKYPTPEERTAYAEGVDDAIWDINERFYQEIQNMETD